MEPLLSQWTQEQTEIASKVKIRPDDPLLLRDYPGSLEFSSHATLASSSSLLYKDKLIGGVDVSFSGDGDSAVAVYVITRNLEVIYRDSLVYTVTQCYVSSFLAFREMEPLQILIGRQRKLRPEMTPCVILVDGNGIFHERRAGLATFVGVKTNIPTIGVAKTLYCTDGLSVDLVERQVASSLLRLAQYFIENHQEDDSSKAEMKVTHRGGTETVSMNNNSKSVCVFCKTPIHATGEFDTSSNISSNRWSSEKEVKGLNKIMVKDALNIIADYCTGMCVPLMGEKSGEILAAALVGHGGKILASSSGKREKKQIGTKNPIYISVGHDISLHEAVTLCCALSLARIPEPVRQADLIGREIMKNRQNEKT